MRVDPRRRAALADELQRFESNLEQIGQAYFRSRGLDRSERELDESGQNLEYGTPVALSGPAQLKKHALCP
eukprot:CAMPEP_0185612544 /NCGR_PEP_ID=MMETSP0436-20130131/22197_1 /TAXON_ID=626734 ORGANISM="Favella taraikaensis, Strain Fe Narragansett Bay" /NCGR_SAMPLE_ID=MMETSP0436 /ASSEMBLY_ACC=CAM_ASM_000390 /LENGTH=70 /DNA_ID=CAMNT_0028246011 /DNA_START=376 /DNA_END=584 /DNA_ORIENTATION=-